MGSNSIAIETHEVVDAQIIDKTIIIRVQTGKILVEIESVGSNSPGKLEKGQVVPQIELRVYAMLL